MGLYVSGFLAKPCIKLGALLPLQTRGGAECSYVDRFVKTLASNRAFDDDIRVLLLTLDLSAVVILLWGLPCCSCGVSRDMHWIDVFLMPGLGFHIAGA